MLAAAIPVAGVAVHSPAGRSRVRRLLPGVAAVAPAAALPAADGLLVAVPDDVLRRCAAALASRVPADARFALHTSGLHPGSVLAPLRERGIAVGSFHPLMSFPAPGGPAVALAGALATVEGDPAARRAGLALARALGMKGRRLEAADKPLYHAAAVLAANLTHVLVAEARAMLERVGLGRAEAGRALCPLVDGAVAAALAADGLERLSGPLARGDGAVIAAHLRLLDAPAAAAYRSVALLAVARMRASGDRDSAAKSAVDSVLRALTATGACGSVPADGLD